MHYVYAIKSQLNGRIYVGQTKDIEERLDSHNKGKAKSTKGQKPWELFAVQSVDSREQATWIEKRIKNSHGTRLKWLKQHRIK